MRSSIQTFDAIILGGGASGLFCALTAAKRGLKVIVLEKANKPGKKILMSGGGRCNFTNHLVSADNFISNNPHFCKSALKRYTQWDFISLVEQHGIEYEERRHSQLFCQHSAKDILNMLLNECADAGVEIETHCEDIRVTSIKSASTDPDNSPEYKIGFSREAQPRTLYCRSLVVATGALSVPTLGGSGLGYDIANQFSLPLTQRRAGLVPLMFTDSIRPLCDRLSGLAVDVEIHCKQHSFRENMLFTHRGISGPSVLQISNYWLPGDTVNIDLLPELDASEWLLALKRTASKSLLKTPLQHKLAKPLVTELENQWWTQYARTPLAEIPDQALVIIAQQLKGWQLKPSASEGYRTAEVTLGGVDTDALSSKTMAAKNQPGLHFIGEVVDVSGHLGGFNFQWAWSSAYAAGIHLPARFSCRETSTTSPS